MKKLKEEDRKGYICHNMTSRLHHNLFQLFPSFFIRRQERFNERSEAGAVVLFFDMTDFMTTHIVKIFLVEMDEIEIEHDMIIM